VETTNVMIGCRYKGRAKKSLFIKVIIGQEINTLLRAMLTFNNIIRDIYGSVSISGSVVYETPRLSGRTYIWYNSRNNVGSNVFGNLFWALRLSGRAFI
jgi:hypothetical protein